MVQPPWLDVLDVGHPPARVNDTIFFQNSPTLL